MQLLVKNLTAKYGRKKYAARNVCFTCGDDEIIGITGPSGAGKSSLGRCIAGLQKAQAGRIYVDEQLLNLDCKEAVRFYRQTIQFVFQDPLASLPAHLPIGIPLLDAAKIFYCNRSQRRDAVAEILGELKLEQGILERRPSDVSGGQRQRIALARALIVKPRFIILDEAVSALDPINRRGILDLLLEHRERYGLGIILISHNIGVLTDFCTRIVIYDDCEIVKDSTPQNMKLHSITRTF